LISISFDQPPAMRGQVIMVPVLEASGAQGVGRFGWKDQHASLVSMVADDLLNNIGITSPIQPTENTSNGQSVSGFDGKSDPEVGMTVVDALATFIRSTKAPPRDAALAATPDAIAGEQLFASVGCATCHVSTIVTAPAGTMINGGTFQVPPALGNKTIHPFSDFLLHDVGAGDGIVENGGQTTRNKVRTAPLWGVRTRTRLMHDGSTRTLDDAIAFRHFGEAISAKNNYQALTPEEKNQLITFLRSL
jgi:CxxC motif-containing protein (DUF1111 family)